MEPFKNWFSPELVRALGAHLQIQLDDFDRQSFETAILSELDSLELKARAQLIADQVHIALPTLAPDSVDYDAPLLLR